MKKLILFLFLIGFTAQFSTAQKLINAKKVPAIVIRHFEKKYRHAEKPKWYILEKEHNYLVKFYIGKLRAEVTYTNAGRQIHSKMEVFISKLNSRIANDIHKNHRDKKVKEAFLIVNSPRDKYYSVILTKSQGRKKPPLVYEAQYNFNGSYLTLYEPEIKDDPKADKGPDKYEKEMDKETQELEGGYQDQKIGKNDLPSPVISYLKKHYGIEYHYKEIFAKHNNKYGDYYYVVLKKQGEKVKHLFYFDMYGKLIKTKDVDL